MAPPADDSEVMVHSALDQENTHVVLDMKELKEPLVDSQGNYIVDAQGQYKDGADMFGPKMQQLRIQLLQQHEEYQKHREVSNDTKEQQEDKPHLPHKPEASLAKKGISLGVWFCFNSLTLILNKYLFSIIDFHYPLSLTAVHMVTCFFLAFLIIKVFKWIPYQPLSRREILTKILPLSIVFCANIVFGNFSIRWIPISFMQTVKSSVPVFTVFLQWAFYKQTCSRQVAYSLIPVVGGVALASCTELNFVMGGFICALFGSLLTALQAVILHSSAVKLNPVNLILYTSPISLMMLIIPCLAFEFNSIRTEWQYYGDLSPILWLAVSGTVAFALNYSSFIVSSVLSALTMTVAGNFKAVINIVASVLVFGNPITWVNWFGCIVATGGVMWYNQLMTRQKLATK
jgi:solute carrier family 35 protein E3